MYHTSAPQLKARFSFVCSLVETRNERGWAFCMKVSAGLFLAGLHIYVVLGGFRVPILIRLESTIVF